MEQRYRDFNDLIDDDFGGDDIDTDMDVDEDDQPTHTVAYPVTLMHIFEAKELMVWCALLVMLTFCAGMGFTFAILKGAGAL